MLVGMSIIVAMKAERGLILSIVMAKELSVFPGFLGKIIIPA